MTEEKKAVKEEKKAVKFYSDSAYKVFKTGIQFQIEGEHHELPHNDIYVYETDDKKEIDILKKCGFNTDKAEVFKRREEKIKANLKKIKMRSKADAEK